MSKPLKVFITYSHKNRKQKNKLITYLDVMRQEGSIDIWHDNEILAGDTWKKEIFSTNLPESDLLIYLVSSDSLASENCNKELAEVLAKKDIRVIFIVLESCDWKNYKLGSAKATSAEGLHPDTWEPQMLGDILVLPTEGRPLNEWNPRSKGWQNVVKGTRAVIRKLQIREDSAPRRSEREVDAERAFQQGNFLFRLEQIDEAIEAYSWAIELNPRHVAAHNNRGNAYREIGEAEHAIKDFNTAIRLNPRLAEPYNNRGVVYYDKGDFDLAIENFNAVIELNSDYANAYNNRGIACRDRGEINLAIEDFDLAIRLNPCYADYYNSRGIAYHKKGEVNTAIKDFDKAIKLNSNYANAYNNRGIAYDEQGEISLAIKDYNTAIKLNPRDPKPYNNRGTLISNQGEHDRAIEDFDKAIALRPNYAEAYSNRGGVYRSIGDHDKAIKDCTKAIELKPDTPAPYNNRGAAYRNKGEIDRAIKDYNKAIELEPNYFLAYHNRAIAHFQQRELDQAIKDYTKVIELNPALAVAFNNRGVAHYRNGEYNRAIEDYKTAIKLDYTNAYYNRAETWLHLREWEKAKTDLTTAKKKGVDIVAAFRNDYKNIAAFERANQVKLPEDIAELVRHGFRNRYPKKEKVLTADVELFDSAEVYNLMKALRETGTPLKEYIKTQPFFGIKTTPTDVFVVDSKTRDKLIEEHSSSADILKPLLHGRDIRRWQVEPPKQWLIFAYRGIEINAYPAIRNYLEKHRDSLSKRKGKEGWYELQASIGEIERYAGPKLVCPNLYNTQTFAVETEGYYCGSTCYIIPTDETWLCGLLNTRTVEWFYSQISDQLGPGELQARSRFIKQIPVPDLNAEQKNLVRKIVEYLIYLQNQPSTSGKDLAHARDFLMLKYFERIINGLVYEFYMPDVLQDGNRDIFKHLMAEQLSEVKEIHGDKMLAFRALYERLYHKEHPVRINLFFQDSLRPIRIIEDKW